MIPKPNLSISSQGGVTEIFASQIDFKRLVNRSMLRVLKAEKRRKQAFLKIDKLDDLMVLDWCFSVSTPMISFAPDDDDDDSGDDDIAVVVVVVEGARESEAEGGIFGILGLTTSPVLMCLKMNLYLFFLGGIVVDVLVSIVVIDELVDMLVVSSRSKSRSTRSRPGKCPASSQKSSLKKFSGSEVMSIKSMHVVGSAQLSHECVLLLRSPLNRRFRVCKNLRN
jgi:hypothetical protein